MREGLAGLLSDVANLDAAHATDTAQSLTAVDAFPIDYVARVRAIFGLRNREFVDALYTVVLGREPDPTGRAAYVADLTARRPRMEIVREIVDSVEARGLGVDARFLERLELLDPPEALRRVRACWTLPRGRFVRELWVALAEREPTPAERDTAYARLDTGSRRDVLELLLALPEARARVATPSLLLDAELLDREAIERGLARLAAQPAEEFVRGSYGILTGA